MKGEHLLQTMPSSFRRSGHWIKQNAINNVSPLDPQDQLVESQVNATVNLTTFDLFQSGQPKGVNQHPVEPSEVNKTGENS